MDLEKETTKREILDTWISFQGEKKHIERNLSVLKIKINKMKESQLWKYVDEKQKNIIAAWEDIIGYVEKNQKITL